MCATPEATSDGVSGLSLVPASEFNLHQIKSGGLSISVLPNGCIHSIECHGIQINQVLASPVAGGIHRIYLRLFRDDGAIAVEIVGPGAASVLSVAGDRFVWSGTWQGISYRCVCHLSDLGHGWIFHIELTNSSGEQCRCDAVLVQDLGLATAGQVRNNELFTSQYLDHSVTVRDDIGAVVMTRQNLPQPRGTHPWLMQGCLPACSGFCTDGFDFFGVQFKENAVASGLLQDVIGQSVRQYETAYIALQSSRLNLPPTVSGSVTFFARYQANHPAASADADALATDLIPSITNDITASTVTREDPVSVTQAKTSFQTGGCFIADDLTASELSHLFPGPHRHEEWVGDQLHSFFHGDDSGHVVLKVKELAVARPHGHIMRSGEGFTPAAEILSSAFYAAGVFASQLALGHTSIGKLLSGVRDPLNIIRSSGLRIFIRKNNTECWQLLGVPSAFAMLRHECCWHYNRGGRSISIRCCSAKNDAAFSYTIKTTGGARELLIVGELCAGASEYEHPIQIQVDSTRGRISVTPSKESFLGKKQPDISFHFVTPDPHALASVGGDELLFSNGVPQRLPYCGYQTKPVEEFHFTVLGAVESLQQAELLCKQFESSAERPLTQSAGGKRFWKGITREIVIDSATSKRISAIQDALNWFARDAMIHLATPRGLEQANGGAWGVRDVCQGPVEFLLSYGHDGVVADIVRTLFSQQYRERCDWPQWFMFPPFQEIQSSHAHGDVLIWPLKALCDYLEQSNDGSILHELLPYTDDTTLKPTTSKETLLKHTDRLLDKMQSDFVTGISLPKYGDGDWDDSLQPAEASLREKMVSSWTTELLYQTLRRFGVALAHFKQSERSARARQMASNIATDFQRFLVPNGVVAGFAVFQGAPATAVEYLLHPSDTRTGLKYRLIPMTRGIISGIFSEKQALAHLQLVNQHLLFPDGARLMDRPTAYAGGLEKTFRRAESASFFGREIGLQYVHAHLRYAEALAVMGRADELLHALLVVNPIAVTQVVPNAQPRQRNCFFSSSDAVFADRYHASRDYEKLRKGEIPTHGGWRVYSSGPGIYTNLVVRHLFGIRNYFDSIELDPVLPRELDGSTLQIQQDGREVAYTYRVRTASCSPARIVVNGIEISSRVTAPYPYRAGGVRVKRSDFAALLGATQNRVEIEL